MHDASENPSAPAALGAVAGLCNGDRVSTIVVSSGGAGYGFLVDDRGRLHQAGFGPDIDAHMERLPAGIPPALYPLAYPAYDEEPTRAPALRVTHSDGTTTTRLEVEDVRVVGAQTDVLLVDPDCPLEVTLSFHTEDHGVLRQWVSVTNRQPAAITLHEVAAASPLLAVTAPHLMHFGGGDWAAEWTTTTEALTPGTKVVDSRGGVQPHLRCLPLLPARPRRATRGVGRCRPRRGAGLGGQHPLRLRADERPHACGSGAGTTRRPPSTCSTPAPPSSPPSRSGPGRPRGWAR